MNYMHTQIIYSNKCTDAERNMKDFTILLNEINFIYSS